MKEISKNKRKIIYILGTLSVMVTVLGTYYLSKNTGTLNGTLWGYGNINITMITSSVFLFFKYDFKLPKSLKNIFMSIAKYTLGIYLIHPAVIKIVPEEISFFLYSFNPLISVPFITMIIYLISLLLSMFIKKNTFIFKRII